MTQRPFRFVHSAKFQLERPFPGVAELSDRARNICLEAPYVAARRVFELAISRRVDFLLLVGELLDSDLTGQRGPRFLCEQFERAHEAGVAVVWVDISSGSRRAATNPGWPPHVKLLSLGQSLDLQGTRDARPFCRVYCPYSASSEENSGDSSSLAGDALYSIAAMSGTISPAALQASRRDYWALSGGCQRETSQAGERIAHDPGSPQSRDPDAEEPHGCTLVEVGDDGRTRASFLATDAARWLQERIQLEGSFSREALDRAVRQRARELTASAPQVEWFVHWIVEGPAPSNSSFWQGEAPAELLRTWRRELAERDGMVWSASVTRGFPGLSRDLASRESRDDDSVTSFLRIVDRLRDFSKSRDGQNGPNGQRAASDSAFPATNQDGEAPSWAELTSLMNLDDLLAAEGRESEWSAALRQDEPRSRERVLRQVAALGADLLTGEDHRT